MNVRTLRSTLSELIAYFDGYISEEEYAALNWNLELLAKTEIDRAWAIIADRYSTKVQAHWLKIREKYETTASKKPCKYNFFDVYVSVRQFVSKIKVFHVWRPIMWRHFGETVLGGHNFDGNLEKNRLGFIIFALGGLLMGTSWGLIAPIGLSVIWAFAFIFRKNLNSKFGD